MRRRAWVAVGLMAVVLIVATAGCGGATDHRPGETGGEVRTGGEPGDEPANEPGDEPVDGVPADPGPADPGRAGGERPDTTALLYPSADSPLTIVVRVGDRESILVPHSFCYDGTCADGAPVPNAALPDVGAGGRLVVEFALSGWGFTAGLTPAGTPAGAPAGTPATAPADEVQVPLRAAPDGTFVLDAAGPAGTYVVSLFGRGEGDAAYRFRWTAEVTEIAPPAD